MADETLVLDASEVATDRTSLSIHDLAGPIRIKGPDGVDWGDAEMAAYSAELERGEAPVDGRFPNRRITIPLQLKEGGGGGVTFDQARRKLQHKVALFQREGGWLKRELRDGTKLYLDVVNATLGLGGHTFQATGRFDTEVDLVLDTLPDWYGDEITLADHTETTNPELIFTETSIKGDLPARCRIVVDEDDGDSQYGLVWGVRSKNYSSASTAALAYQAETLTPLDTAATTALTGASGAGSNTIRHNSLGTDWSPVLSTQASGGGAHMTHVGTYRVKARVYSTSTAETVQVRLNWDVGDMTGPVENAPWEIPGASQFYVADLGEVRIDRAITGTHRWIGVVQAKGEAAGTNVYVDRIWFVPADEFSGELSAEFSTEVGIAGYTARDEFNQSTGNLTGKTLPVGGTWAGAGDADDFIVVGGDLQRGAALGGNDSANTGRYVIAGTSVLTDTVVSVQPTADNPHLGQTWGVFLRYVDTSNWLRLVIQPNTNQSITVRVQKRVAGTITTLASRTHTITYGAWGEGGYDGLIFQVVGGAYSAVYVIHTSSGGYVANSLSGTDSVLASGGTLDDGKVGIYHEDTAVDSSSVLFDNFAAYVPNTNAVMFASQSATLQTDGIVREDSTGTAYGPVARIKGDLPRIPPSGLESRTCQFFIKGSRGDLGTLPDSGIDDISARVYYRPSYLFAPDPA